MSRQLATSSLGLVNEIRTSMTEANENFLLVVDQFEELFRYRESASDPLAISDIQHFVNLLIEAVEQTDIPIYTVLTLRGDFLGDCVEFTGLPEILNDSQYLVPKLTRSEMQDAIEGPLRVVGAGMTHRLVQTVLMDASRSPNELPVLQHALARTYEHWRERGSHGEIDLPDYAAVGGIEHALEQNAEEIYSSLRSKGRQVIAEKLFRCLTLMQDGRPVRRPRTLDHLLAVLNENKAGEATVREVLQPFLAAPSSFILSSTGSAGVSSDFEAD